MEGEDPVLQGADGEEELLVLSPVQSSISLTITVLRREVGGLGSVFLLNKLQLLRAQTLRN